MKNKKGNMYEFVDIKWNPLAGECQHGCIYCSTKKFMRYPEVANKYSGLPRINEKQLKNLGKNKVIFVCAQNDLFADMVNRDIVRRIVDHCKKYDNTYIFQTKNPGGFNGINFPEKTIYCVTTESNRDYNIYKYPTPMVIERFDAISRFQFYPIMLTIEPILDFDFREFVSLIEYINPYQVNIGADSGNNHLPEPNKEKVLALLSELSKFTTVHQKSNLKRLLQ